MAESKDIASELTYRIQADAEHFGGTLPERVAISWRGYLAALLEWGLLAVEHYDELLQRVPDIADDPALDILRGRPDESDGAEDAPAALPET